MKGEHCRCRLAGSRIRHIAIFNSTEERILSVSLYQATWGSVYGFKRGNMRTQRHTVYTEYDYPINVLLYLG